MNQERITFPLERNTLGRMKGGGGSFKLFMTSSLDELTEQHFIFIN